VGLGTEPDRLAKVQMSAAGALLPFASSPTPDISAAVDPKQTLILCKSGIITDFYTIDL
jgi:hypothetical protein